MRQRLVGGRVLVAGGGLEETSVEVQDGQIAGVGGSGDGAAAEIDVGGALVLPGIVDFHGDAFERQVMPRPGVRVPIDIALLDTDAQLAAAGITTAFHGITCSWEPGLRSVATMRELFDGFARLAPTVLVDHRVHLRYEADNLDAVDEVAEGMRAGRIHLLALNDHTPAIASRLDRPDALAKYTDRACVSAERFRELCLAAMERRREVPAAIETLTGVAREAGVPIAAHVVRGGSHLGNGGAADYVAEGLCGILASDYHYPSLFNAPFKLATTGKVSFADAWRLVSAAPAAAVGLHDRGEIRPGARADILVVRDGGVVPRLARVMVGGSTVYATGHG
jgi:alpha-D-ribose 1-methylphosphonate 5-triphosphate diphosphatase